MPRISAARAIPSNLSPDLIERRIARSTSSVHRSTGILEVTSDGRILHANQAARVIAGSKPNANPTVLELLDLSYHDLILLAQDGRELCEYEVVLTRQNGTSIPVALSVIARTTAPETERNLLVTIRSLVEERITSAIRERIRSSKTAKEIFDVMAEEIIRWVPFIHCTASIYNENLTQARILFSAGPIAVAWPSLYTDLTGEQAEWLREAKKGPIGDLRLFRLDPRWRMANDADLVQAMEHLKSAFRVPVVRNNRVAGSVNFFRDKINAFSNEFEFELLCNLPIDNLFLIALSYLENEEFQFQIEMMKQLADRSSPEILDNAAAQMIVDRLAQHYGWEAITICKVNRQKQCYELQARGGTKSGLINPHFSQRLDEGVMGQAYKQNDVKWIPDLSKNEQYAHLFISKHKIRVRSELCIPIRAGAEIIGMLNIEDSRRNAVAKTERDTIQDLLKKIESMVERQKDESIINAAFNWAPSALFIVDANGIVEKINGTAVSMMGCKAEEIVGRPLDAFLEPSEIASRLLNGSEFRDDVRLIRNGKTPLKVNVASSLIRPMMGATVSVKDARSQERIEELEGLERIFSDIAAQTKIPLALAFSELHNMKRHFQAPGSDHNDRIADDLDKICRHLRRAEITYDHLALYDKSLACGMQANPIIVEAGKLLETLIGELPSADAQRINISGDAYASRILVDVYQVSWILLALLSYGLRLLPESKKLTILVTLKKNGKRQWVHFRMDTAAPAPVCPARRKSDIFVAQVISDLNLGRPAIEAFVQANGGRAQIPKKLEGPLELSVAFPVAQIAGSI